MEIELYFDDEGYVCFDDKDYTNQTGPGIVWTVHHHGWDAIVNDDKYDVLLETGEIVQPDDADIKEARAAYEKIYPREVDERRPV